MRNYLARFLANLRHDLAFRPTFEHWLLIVLIVLLAGIILALMGLLG